MARIRTIKPEFWTSEQVAECSPNARLLFIGIWNFCDDGGVMPAKTKPLKAKIFPYDAFTDEQISSWVNELIKNKLICVYACNDEEFWHVTGWDKHQKIDKPSYKYPRAFAECSENSSGELDERHPAERKGKERKGYIPEDFRISDRVIKWAKSNNHFDLDKHFDYFVSVSKAKGYQYVDWDEAFMNAIRGNWAKINSDPGNSSKFGKGNIV